MSEIEGSESLRQVLDELVEHHGAKNVTLALKRVIDLKQSPDWVSLQDALAEIPEDGVPSLEQGYDISDRMHRLGMNPARLPESSITIEIFDNKPAKQTS